MSPGSVRVPHVARAAAGAAAWPTGCRCAGYAGYAGAGRLNRSDPVRLRAVNGGRRVKLLTREEPTMGGFMDKAKEFADQHDEQVDQGMEKAGDFADEKTGGKYGEKVDRGVDAAQERTGDGDTQP